MNFATQPGSATLVQPSPTTIVDVQTTGVSWAAIAAGAVAAAALTLLLVALGAGLGLSAVSPWSGAGVSATTFKVGTGIYLLVVAVMASAVGGYLAARLRTRWSGLNPNEVFFRDTAHGLVAWAFATVISASVLGAATTHIASGAVQGLGAGAAQSAAQANPADVVVDRLFRADPQQQLPARRQRRPRRTPGALKYPELSDGQLSVRAATSLPQIEPTWPAWSPRAPGSVRPMPKSV